MMYPVINANRRPSHEPMAGTQNCGGTAQNRIIHSWRFSLPYSTPQDDEQKRFLHVPLTSTVDGTWWNREITSYKTVKFIPWFLSAFHHFPFVKGGAAGFFWPPRWPSSDTRIWRAAWACRPRPCPLVAVVAVVSGEAMGSGEDLQ